jgi:hypothetical protein
VAAVRSVWEVDCNNWPENPNGLPSTLSVSRAHLLAQGHLGLDTNDTKSRESDIAKIRWMCTLSVLWEEHAYEHSPGL